MIIKLMAQTIPVLLALASLLVQPKKDPNKPVSISNLNKAGVIMCMLILFLGGAGIYQMLDSEKRSRIEKNELQNNNSELRKQLTSANTKLTENQRLIDKLLELSTLLTKVVSVADGYNAHIRGTISFRQSKTEDQIKSALKNLFSKFVNVNIVAYNQLGKHKGRIDHSVNPHVRRFRRVTEIGPGSDLMRYIQESFRSPFSYFFEVKVQKLKILNEDKIQFVKLHDSKLELEVESFPHWRDFGNLYHVDRVYIGDILIEELAQYPIGQHLEF